MTEDRELSFEAFFRGLQPEAHSFAPHPWQYRLADLDQADSRLLRIPTGLGKTLGVLAAWLWHRVHHNRTDWPRRLVWCLPMRALVDQTYAVAQQAVEQLGLTWPGGEASHTGRIGVHRLMGGLSKDVAWSLYPEDFAILIGTQDMLLSRALNRGYAASRARWPQEFGLLNQDALWVMDEIQLMDVGLATTAQLQAILDEDSHKALRPRHSWWMSATLQPRWLASVDTAPHWPQWRERSISLPAAERDLAPGAQGKSLEMITLAPSPISAFAQTIQERHAQQEPGEYGRITLVICNTVQRANETFTELQKALKKQEKAPELHLVHSRFRSAERAHWQQDFLNRAACKSGADRIIIATQVVEAGVDLSASLLITELAPWASLVQRFGRCARYGGAGQVLVVDFQYKDKDWAPYEVESIEAAREALQQLSAQEDQAGIAALEAFEARISADFKTRLYPYEPALLLRREEYELLFDTSTDLSGADLDVSPYIRSGEERDLLVFWLDLPKSLETPAPTTQPSREALCRVPVHEARKWLLEKDYKLKDRARAWCWDWHEGRWLRAQPDHFRPGRILCVSADTGGYSVEAGFSPQIYKPVPLASAPDNGPQDRVLEDAQSESGEPLSELPQWQRIGEHGEEVGTLAQQITARLGLPEELHDLFYLAGRWHDYGKAHPAFQGIMRAEDRPEFQDLAKAPYRAWLRPPGTYRTADDLDQRKGLRHELASALALFAVLERYNPDHPALLGPYRALFAQLEALESGGVVDDRERITEEGAEPAEDLPETGEEPEALAEEREELPAPTPIEAEVLACTAKQFNLLAYLVAAHHGKVRVSLHNSPADRAQTHLKPSLRGLREGDTLAAVRYGEHETPALQISLEPSKLGLSMRMGESWRERCLKLIETYSAGTLAWLEALLVAADRRISRSGQQAIRDLKEAP